MMEGNPQERIEDKKEKLQHYIGEVLNHITDANGRPIEQGVKEPLALLNLLGYPTVGSCEGHEEEHGLPYPWIDISVSRDERFSFAQEVHREHQKETNNYFASLYGDDESKWPKESWDGWVDKYMEIRDADPREQQVEEIQKEIVIENEKLIGELQKMLDEKYTSDSAHKYILRLSGESWRLMPSQVPEGKEGTRMKDKSPILSKTRKEFDRVVEILKGKYFSL